MPHLPAGNQNPGERRRTQRACEPTQPNGHEPAAVNLAGGAAHQGGSYLACFLGVSAEQGAIAGHIDHARDSHRQAVYLGQGRRREYFLGRTRDAQSMAHIALGFFPRQGFQVVAAGNSLCQLAQLGAVQQFAKLRLADQDDLQKLLRGCFQIGKQTDLFQDVDAKILRLIHQHDDAPAFRVRFQQSPVQRIDHLFDAVAIGLGDAQSQLFADRQQEFRRV